MFESADWGVRYRKKSVEADSVSLKKFPLVIGFKLILSAGQKIAPRIIDNIHLKPAVHSVAQFIKYP